MGLFNEAVYAVVRRVPRGKVVTYGQVARLIGQPRKARFVGYAMRSNPSPQPGAGPDEDCVPCHRVVFKDGSVCESYAFGGPGVQRSLLEAEGVPFLEDGRVDLARCQWDGRSDPSVAAPLLDGAESDAFPLGPPEDFDWEAELGEL